MKNYYLGIDTSNYTTSVAAVSEDGRILFDRRQVLKVKEGERGLRQSQALFEHICNLPEVISGLKEAAEAAGYALGGVGVSTRPRPVEGSYMPCFKAGETAAKVIAETSGVPVIETSHQEGHIAAAGGLGEDFIAFHLSGGTSEILLCSKCEGGGYSVEIVGGTKDISFGQLIDRVGVSLGMKFPCGKEVDRLALEKEAHRPEFGKEADRLAIHNEAEKQPFKSEGKSIPDANPFCKIAVNDCGLNISGIETQAQRYISGLIEKNKAPDKSTISAWILERISEALEKSIVQARKKTGVKKVLLIGGVSSSGYIRKIMKKDENIVFGNAELCADNAVGVARICAEALGSKRQTNAEGRANAEARA